MPSFDFVQTIVSAFVLVFLLANIVLHVIDRFKEGFQGEIATTAATSGPQIDYASQISTDMSELFEKVNKQMEISKTIKIPISTDTVTISYNRDLDPKIQIYGNLLTLVNDGIMRVELDLKNVQTYQYIGNESVQNMADELAKINENTVLAKCSVESFQDMSAPTSAPTISAETSAPSSSAPSETTSAAKYSAAVTSCLRKNEYEMIQRVKVIVDNHQKIIDKILEKRASA
jgi:hypothetical protein